jgi:hypothetical protein
VGARASGARAVVMVVRVIDTRFARGSLRPRELGRHIPHLRALLTRERPDVVHAIALKPMALLAFSGYRDAGLVFALTGRGYLGVRRWFWQQAVSEWLRNAFRSALRRPRAVLLVENTADRDWLASRGDLDAQTLLMPGAGVNPEVYAPAPQPAQPPIVVGVVTRLIWTIEPGALTPPVRVSLAALAGQSSAVG